MHNAVPRVRHLPRAPFHPTETTLLPWPPPTTRIVTRLQTNVPSGPPLLFVARIGLRIRAALNAVSCRLHKSPDMGLERV